ncbi:MAG TPA: thiamine pyrophosphate-binding protein [Micromonosporaceae bacterium]|nr:thiamine pyrophosphate-binding protein [Micromonosporaceae bacterium]
MDAATRIGQLLAGFGVDHVFGVVGSGNFHVTNALVAAGARFVPAAHEAGAATTADAYARVSGKVGVVSVHQGPGVTNAMTGIAEAAKSRTPMIVLAPEATNPRSNFFIDLAGVAGAVGAHFHRVVTGSVTSDVARAWELATTGLGGTVVLGMPLEVQAARVDAADLVDPTPPDPLEQALRQAHAASGNPEHAVVAPGQDAAYFSEAENARVERLAEVLAAARRPVFIAGRGAARVPWDGTRDALMRLARDCGALLATSAAAKGLFAGFRWNLDVSGGFASPLAAELIGAADVIVAWGSTLNMWTTRHGQLLPQGATVVRVDHDPAALDQPLIRPVADRFEVRGEVRHVAAAVHHCLIRDGRVPDRHPWREEVGERIAAGVRWRDVAYQDESTATTIDARTLSIAFDDMLPAERLVAVDSGNFMGYPSMFLTVPDASGFCFTQAYQSVGLGLASAVGAALARPDRLTVAALGDGGFLMSVAELTTVARLGLPMLVVVYDDAAYGAEVHHFGPDGHVLDTVRFPDPPIASIAEGFGCVGVTVRGVGDLGPVRDWLAGPRERPLVVDAKVAAERGSWWLEEAFRGH